MCERFPKLKTVVTAFRDVGKKYLHDYFLPGQEAASTPPRFG
jgi:hypothetical protein